MITPRQETSRSQVLAEDVPDGSFGGARVVARPRRSHDEPLPDPLAAEHWQQLLDALTRPHTPSNRPAVTPGMCNPNPAVSNRKAA